jgi:peptide/nickel transport system permease protein
VINVIIRRVLISIPLLFVVSITVFVLQSFIPGDAARTLAGLQATPADVEALRVQLHLNDPLFIQYFRWLSELLFHGSLGTSLSNSEPVTQALGERLGVTLSLVGAATIVATVLGVILGIVSSRGKKGLRAASDVFSIAGMAIPGFWLALLLVSLFSVTLGLFPANGYIQPSDSLSGWAWSLVLPVAALAFSGVTAIAKITREGMLDTLDKDFIRNLRANGVSERRVIFKHALRSTSLPVVTVSGLLFVGSLSASVVIEQIFGLGGLGSLAVTATGSHDIPLIQGVALYFTLIVIGMNLIIDLLYGLLDPRARTS